MGVNKDKKIRDKINANDMVIKISNSQLSNTISSRMGTLLKCGLSIGVKKIAKNPVGYDCPPNDVVTHYIVSSFPQRVPKMFLYVKLLSKGKAGGVWAIS